MLAAFSAHAAAALVLAAAALMLAAPLGYRVGLWSALTALTKVLALGVVAGGLAAAASLVSLASGGGRAGTGTAAMLLAVVLAAVTAATLALRLKKIAQRLPFNDISTDSLDAPAFDALLAPRRRDVPGACGAYAGAAAAAMQHANFPDLAPRHLAMPPDAAFAHALATARAMGWTIVAENAARGRIEAFDRTLWFGFVDDIIVRLAPESDGTRLDIRSASRVGVSDLGKNAKRVRAYLAALTERARSPLTLPRPAARE